MSLVSGEFVYRSTAESCMEFSGNKIPGTYNIDYTIPDTRSIDFMATSGLNTIRLPFLWERLQPTANGPFDSFYFNLINKTVDHTTNTKGMYILLDVHNYARYYNQIFKVDEFANLWSQLASQYKNNDRVLFGLMNEPNGLPVDLVVTAMQAAINAIRSTGAKNLITVAGDSWTGVHSWMQVNAAAMIAITDPANNFMYEMHQYFDNNFSGTGPCDPNFNVTAIFDPVTNWLRQNQRSCFLGEFGIESNPQCLNVLNRVMAYLKENSDVWKGFSWWAAGPWWNTYFYSIEPISYNPPIERGRQLSVIQKYI
eukprot:TRINITY_DN2381_c0_g1_i1.p1 TRINITY_DN2381_c0_g1~~TRINITY_DN2381_c0_g1_i1.p1  ORF type:complete len:329 (-),score=51.89 TRINITY_DN2381_c0_g1_i1:163-1095(-)